MRWLPLLMASALLASCGSDEVPPADNAATNTASDEDPRVMCALKGADRFERKCMPEWVDGEGGRLLVLRAPDGGFRRLLLTGDGRGLIAADGAEPAVITPYANNQILVTIGGDRYRLPAKFEGTAP